MAEKHWKIPKVQAPDYDREQRGRIAAYEEALAVQLGAKPARLEHSMSVARTAEAMQTIRHKRIKQRIFIMLCIICFTCLTFANLRFILHTANIF